MPIFEEIHVGDGKIVIWKINEVLEFFESRTGLKAPQSNPKKQLEHLCGRYLLTLADPKINLESLDVDQHDKPYCKDYNGHFSISHSYPYVAVYVHPTHAVGIDIQVWHQRMLQLQHKFLIPQEIQLANNDEKLITAFWNIKEAAYKWYGKKGIQLQENILIKKINNIVKEAEVSVFHEDAIFSSVFSYFYYDDFSLAYNFIRNYKNKYVVNFHRVSLKN